MHALAIAWSCLTNQLLGHWPGRLEYIPQRRYLVGPWKGMERVPFGPAWSKGNMRIPWKSGKPDNGNFPKVHKVSSMVGVNQLKCPAQSPELQVNTFRWHGEVTTPQGTRTLQLCSGKPYQKSGGNYSSTKGRHFRIGRNVSLTSDTIMMMIIIFRFFIHMARARLRLVVLKVTDCIVKERKIIINMTFSKMAIWAWVQKDTHRVHQVLSLINEKFQLLSSLSNEV